MKRRRYTARSPSILQDFPKEGGAKKQKKQSPWSRGSNPKHLRILGDGRNMELNTTTGWVVVGFFKIESERKWEYISVS